MSKAQHTPGPWHARNDEAITIRDASDNQLAICTHIMTRTGGRRNANEVHATARLIAAAPELLEALESALAWIDAVPNETILPGMPGFDRDEVDALIANAKGEA